MKPQNHSRIFSPSKSMLWLECHQSVLFNDGNNSETNEQAEFGTETHELAAATISNSLNVEDFDGNSKKPCEVIPNLKRYNEEMQEIVNKYADFVIKTYQYELHNSSLKPLVLIEQQLDLGFDDNSIGTLDLGIISNRDGGTLTIVDLKTGRNPVMSFDKELNRPNSQLSIYALATYKCLKDVYPIKKVRLVIFQPVINNTNEYEMEIDELLKFEEEVIFPAVRAIKSGDRTAKENSKCKYCPGFVYCKKKLDSARKIIENGSKIELLSEQEIAEIMPKYDDYIAYFQAVKEHCLKKALGGYHYEGYKLVHSRVTRKINDESKVAEILTEAGYEPYQAKKLLGITELTRKLGKEKFKELVSPYISIQEGSLALVPNSDPREEVIITEENDNVKN